MALLVRIADHTRFWKSKMFLSSWICIMTARGYYSSYFNSQPHYGKGLLILVWSLQLFQEESEIIMNQDMFAWSCRTSQRHKISMVPCETVLENKFIYYWGLYLVMAHFLGAACASSWERSRTWQNKNNAVAGDRTRVTRVTGGNTHHYTTTTLLIHSFP